jgi:hypothetical protein
MKKRVKKASNLKKKVRNDTSSKAKKVVKIKKKTTRKIAPRTRNLGTITEVEYFGKIRSALRRAFRFWKPMQEALNKASRAYSGPNPYQKKEYQCAKCNKWFKRTEVEIDHIEECGELMKLEDIPNFVRKLTPENVDAYQVLCKKDHKDKTANYLKERREAKKLKK